MESNVLPRSHAVRGHESQQENQSTSNSKLDDYFLQLEDMHRVNTLPISLLSLLQHLFDQNVRRPAELLIAIVYYLFLETGHVPTTLHDDQSADIRTHWGFSFTAQIPDKCWHIVANEIVQQFNQFQDFENEVNVSTTSKREQIYTFKLKLLNHSDDETQLVIRKIFDGSALCVTFCLEQYEQSTSVILPVNKFFVVPENCDFNNIRQNPNQFFRGIQSLSEQIKQNLVAPLRNRIMYESAYPNAALNGLPREILWLLFRYFRSDLSTLQKISQTCVYLRNMTITFLSESNIRLIHRRPTPITYNASDHFQPRSRFRIYNVYPWIFHPFDH